jgi:predicted ester cyclase
MIIIVDSYFRTAIGITPDGLAGIHKDEFMDIKPTDKQFRVKGMTIFSFCDAKVLERWNLVDMISLMEQLKT